MANIRTFDLKDAREERKPEFDTREIVSEFALATLQQLRKILFVRMANGAQFDFLLLNENVMPGDTVNVAGCPVNLAHAPAIEFRDEDLAAIRALGDSVFADEAAVQFMRAIDLALQPPADLDASVNRALLVFAVLPSFSYLPAAIAKTHDSAVRVLLSNDLDNGEYVLHAAVLFGVRWISDPARR
jgi:hypothetical protein